MYNTKWPSLLLIDKSDTTSIRQASFGKTSIGQPSVGQVYKKGVDSSINKYKLSIRQVIQTHVISSSRLWFTF